MLEKGGKDMEVLVAYRRGQSKKNKGTERLTVQSGFTYEVLKRLIAEKLSDNYMYKVKPNSIHIRAVDVIIVYDHNDYRYYDRRKRRPHFRPRNQSQHIPRA